MSQVSQPSSAGLVALSDQVHVVPKQQYVVPVHGKDAGTDHQTNCNSQRRGQDIVIYLYLSLSLIRNDIHPVLNITFSVIGIIIIFDLYDTNKNTSENKLSIKNLHLFDLFGTIFHVNIMTTVCQCSVRLFVLSSIDNSSEMSCVRINPTQVTTLD